MQQKESGELPAFTQWMAIGREIAKLQFWSGRYDISIQFWGAGNNNVYVSKDDVEIYVSGGCESPLEAISKVNEWAERSNPRLKYPEGIQISNPQP